MHFLSVNVIFCKDCFHIFSQFLKSWIQRYHLLGYNALQCGYVNVEGVSKSILVCIVEKGRQKERQSCLLVRLYIFWQSRYALASSVQTKKHFPSSSQFNSCMHWHQCGNIWLTAAQSTPLFFYIYWHSMKIKKCQIHWLFVYGAEWCDRRAIIFICEIMFMCWVRELINKIKKVGVWGVDRLSAPTNLHLFSFKVDFKKTFNQVL